jgi:hypothetical protein
MPIHHVKVSVQRACTKSYSFTPELRALYCQHVAMEWNFGDNSVTKFNSAGVFAAFPKPRAEVAVTMKILAPRQFPSHIAAK